MTDILGSPGDIKMTWRGKPELRVRMIRYMMKHRGHEGVRALSKLLKISYPQLFEIGGLEGWLRKRNKQRRQRRQRQWKKLRNFSVEAKYENSSDLNTTGGGKRGKGGGLQDTGRRAAVQAAQGQ
ncbi:MAG: hypothetical protein FH756_10995 [Firmicutes bacterium]|nr:hypothetical protein [Bacillota bacterium]